MGIKRKSKLDNEEKDYYKNLASKSIMENVRQQ